MIFTIQGLIDRNARLYPNQNWVTCAETGKSVTWLQVKEEAVRTVSYTHLTLPTKA